MLCRILGLPAWLLRLMSTLAERTPEARPTVDGQIRTIFIDSRQTIGSPHAHAQLQAQGVLPARKGAARLMRHTQLCAAASPKHAYHR
jgi:hypothetical protein